MGELASTLDALGALAADDLFALSEADLLDRTRELVRARNRSTPSWPAPSAAPNSPRPPSTTG